MENVTVTITNEQARIIGHYCGKAIITGFVDWVNKANPNKFTQTAVEHFVDRFARILGVALRGKV